MSSQKPRTEPYLTVVEEDVPPRKVLLREFPYTVGRARDCSLVVDQEAISRLHAHFDYDHEQVSVTDLGSTNGTYVNRQRLEPHKPRRLKSGDVVTWPTCAAWNSTTRPRRPPFPWCGPRFPAWCWTKPPPPC